MGDNNNTVPNLSHLVSSGDSLSSQGKQQTKAQSASEHDVVDTFWDIPPITFSEVESAVERGEASDAAYAQAAVTSMTAATSSTPVSDAPTVNLVLRIFRIVQESIFLVLKTILLRRASLIRRLLRLQRSMLHSLLMLHHLPNLPRKLFRLRLR